MWSEKKTPISEVHTIEVPQVGKVPVAKGEFRKLPEIVQSFVGHWVEVCKPTGVFIVDGSPSEADQFTQELIASGNLKKLTAYENNYICRTDPKDVARVESKTFICTPDKYATVPHVAEGAKGILGQWISPADLDKECKERFVGCMAGRQMYVIPFSMGPVGSPLSKYGVQVTDSQYVVLCMRIMTRVSPKILDIIKEQKQFVRCVHSIGLPLPHAGRYLLFTLLPPNFKARSSITGHATPRRQSSPTFLMSASS